MKTFVFPGCHSVQVQHTDIIPVLLYLKKQQYQYLISATCLDDQLRRVISLCRPI